MQKTRFHKYIRFMTMVDRCKKKFKSKTYSMHAQKIIFNIQRIKLHRKVKLSLKRINSALYNLCSFAKFVLRQK